jgi:hypothetical protein
MFYVQRSAKASRSMFNARLKPRAPKNGNLRRMEREASAERSPETFEHGSEEGFEAVAVRLGAEMSTRVDD